MTTVKSRAYRYCFLSAKERSIPNRSISSYIHMWVCSPHHNYDNLYSNSPPQANNFGQKPPHECTFPTKFYSMLYHSFATTSGVVTRHIVFPVSLYHHQINIGPEKKRPLGYIHLRFRWNGIGWRVAVRTGERSY